MIGESQEFGEFGEFGEIGKSRAWKIRIRNSDNWKIRVQELATRRD